MIKDYCLTCPGKGKEGCYLGGKIVHYDDIVMRKNLLECRSSYDDVGAMLAEAELDIIRLGEDTDKLRGLSIRTVGSRGYPGGQ